MKRVDGSITEIVLERNLQRAGLIWNVFDEVWQDESAIERLGKGHGAQKLRDLIAESAHARAEHDVALGVDIEPIGSGRRGGVEEQKEENHER